MPIYLRYARYIPQYFLPEVLVEDVPKHLGWKIAAILMVVLGLVIIILGLLPRPGGVFIGCLITGLLILTVGFLILTVGLT